MSAISEIYPHSDYHPKLNGVHDDLEVRELGEPIKKVIEVVGTLSLEESIKEDVSRILNEYDITHSTQVHRMY